jgi:hypothetical protein
MTPTRGALLSTTLFAIAAVAVAGVLPLWLDEILQLIETRDTSTAEMISRLPRNSGAAPLGYLVQQTTLKITGYSIRNARLPAALFSIATVLVVALLSAELGVRFPWLAAALFAIYPVTLRYAAESRVYSQALFLSVLATLIYVRLARSCTWGLAAAYWLALTAAIYTHPYSASVGLAHVAWSLRHREFRTAAYGGIAGALTVLAFLPWYLWSKAAWASGIVREGFHFSASIKTPLLIFREVAGAGYWGSALLLVLCSLAILTGRPSSRFRSLLLLLIAVPLGTVVAADALADYFAAARQFMWMLPATAILASIAVERYRRVAVVLCVLFGIISLRQSVLFFTAPHENWQAAADVIADQVKKGGCVLVAPADSARLYEFFRPELSLARCQAPLMVLAITPATTPEQRANAVTELNAQGYRQQNEISVGRSAVLSFRHFP